MALVGINRVRIKPSSHEHFFGLFWPFFRPQVSVAKGADSNLFLATRSVGFLGPESGPSSATRSFSSRQNKPFRNMSADFLWSRNAIIALCEMAQSHKCLWDPQDGNYMKHKLRRQCFSDMAEELRRKFPDLANLTRGKRIILLEGHSERRAQISAKQDAFGFGFGSESVPKSNQYFFLTFSTFSENFIRI